MFSSSAHCWHIGKYCASTVTVSARCPITVCHSAQTHTKNPADKFISVVNFVSFPFLLKFHFLFWKHPPQSAQPTVSPVLWLHVQLLFKIIQCVARLHSNSKQGCYVVRVFFKNNAADFLSHQRKIAFTLLHQAANNVKTLKLLFPGDKWTEAVQDCQRAPANREGLCGATEPAGPGVAPSCSFTLTLERVQLHSKQTFLIVTYQFFVANGSVGILYQANGGGK